MTATRSVRIGLPILLAAAAATLTTTPIAAAQPLPAYSCKYTFDEPQFGSVKGRECTAASGAPLTGHHWLTFQMTNSETGQSWVCRSVEAAVIPYYMDKIDPGYSDFERAYGHGADAGVCDRILA